MSASLDAGALSARRLGVLGGSFDPPHAGHLHVARTAARAFELDHVVLVPAARPPHKPEVVLAPAQDRMAMLELLIEGEGDLSVWPGELERAGPSYSVDTARALLALGSASQAELFWILGSDNLPGLARWREAEALLSLARPIVVYREGDALETSEQDLAPLSAQTVALVVAGLCQVPPHHASSSQLRRRLAAGEDPGPSLPPRLREYIEARGIYSAA